MSFLIPIDEGGGTPPVVTLAGSSAVAAALTVSNHLRAGVPCSSSVAASLQLGAGGALALQSTSVGASTVVAALRLNDEPNALLAATLAGSSALALVWNSSLGGLSARADGASSLDATLAVEEAEEFGFTFLVDILDTALASAGAGQVTRYTARLVADGVEVPVSDFTLQGPPGVLGVSLSCTLARPDTSLVSSAASVQFDLGVWTGAAFQWVTLLAGGRKAGHELSVGFSQNRPTDTVTLSTLDVTADRWARAPRAPETLYDPDETEEPAKPDPQSLIRNEKGVRILPVNTPVFGLRLHEVLRRAYVLGCGFSEVVTNVENFPVTRADFTLEGGYHGGVAPLLALFEPLYFADGDTLFILDAGAPLPAGLTARELPLSAVVTISDSAPAHQVVNALVLDHKGGAGDYFTERLEQESTESGSFGSAGYTKTETTRRVREYRNLDAPETIVREVVVSTEVETLNSDFEVTGRETQDDSYDALGRPTGHARKLEALVPDLNAEGAPLLLQTVAEEKYSVYYRPGAGASDEIARTVAETSGLVLVDADKPYLGKPYEIPYLDAHHSGYIDPDANQTTEFRAIRTVTETFVREGGEVRLRVQTQNHLNGGAPERSTSATRAGSTAVRVRGQGRTKKLLTVEGTESAGRVIPTFSAGDLPGDLAVTLGRRKLKLLNAPPREASIRLPGVALDIRRGTPVKPHGRSGSLGTYICTGYTITGGNLGTHAQRVEMSLSAKELK